jgi:hypothetical protein
VVVAALTVEGKGEREMLYATLVSEIPSVDSFDSLNLNPRYHITDVIINMRAIAVCSRSRSLCSAADVRVVIHQRCPTVHHHWDSLSPSLSFPSHSPFPCCQSHIIFLHAYTSHTAVILHVHLFLSAGLRPDADCGRRPGSGSGSGSRSSDICCAVQSQGSALPCRTDGRAPPRRMGGRETRYSAEWDGAELGGIDP